MAAPVSVGSPPIMGAGYRSFASRLKTSIPSVRSDNELKRADISIFLPIGQPTVGLIKVARDRTLWSSTHEQQTDDRFRRPCSR